MPNELSGLAVKMSEYTEEYARMMEEKEQEIEILKNELKSCKEMVGLIKKTYDEYYRFKDEMAKKIKEYKQMELEIMFMRGAFIIIIYMYIFGFIRFV